MKLAKEVYKKLQKLKLENFMGAGSNLYGIPIKEEEILKIIENVVHNKKELANHIVGMFYAEQMNPCDMCSGCNLCMDGNHDFTIMTLNIFYVAELTDDYTVSDKFEVTHKDISLSSPERTLSIMFCSDYHWYITDDQVEDMEDHLEQTVPF